MMEDIEDQDSPVQYGPHNDSYAFLIQGSSEWANYRHQADVLNVYQMLRRNGWDDDHIILAVWDKLADNDKNKFKGKVSTSTYGDDLYGNAVIDYSIDSLSVNDIQDIMLGKSSDRLQTVLSTDDKTNVLVFWSGHGCLAATHKVNGFIWGGKPGVFSADDLHNTLEQMHSQRRYRKMLLLLEPCYSRNMASQARQIPGILAIASANGNESSFADFHSSDLSVWMSDRFSNNIVTTLSEKPDQTYREFYEYLYTHTLGSHVYVENSYWFGNLCKSTLGEFIYAKN
jgi:glycosylphosphatidylinositol transamidase (GPIT) subunit GPI8